MILFLKMYFMRVNYEMVAVCNGFENSQLELLWDLHLVKRFFDKHDKDKDGLIDFGEFVKYVRDHESKLRLYFKNIDINDDGSIDKDEIIASFKKLGVNIDSNEADKLVSKMDKDGTLKIEWSEWRDYLILSPSQSIKEILQHWRHASMIDVGENVIVPDDFTEKEMKTGIWKTNLMAGGMAGAVSRSCTAPLDRIKVMLQVHGTGKNQFGVINGFKHMLEEGGVKSLWRGNGVNVIKIAPESAIKFMAYEQFKKIIHGDSKEELRVGERLLAGSLAGATAQTIIYPMEVLKTRLAIRKTGQYKGILDCAMKIHQKEGAAVFYRGYIPNLLGIIPYAGIDLAVYETLKKLYMKKYENTDPGIFVLLGCGTISCTAGQLASYPLALVRTKLQAQGAKADSMLGLFKKIIKQDGLTGLYRGIVPNFMKVIPAVGISYVVYEKSRQWLLN
ncbi:mitochondrial adenyl nucleotide antiporter SLC25A25-like isoform X2 [Ostrea edulis]|uniref:mitochondrial adenyl nucleotide antiporter SLC25A25-like isoform X2 n=1 Tax=Ostrea edulis TaxID=37623 RepID=UPI002095DEDB|nr:mitochondrial adenyl nucleotide antiporter SLC25A25-like isoform X2 [Ostrea edulis]